MYFSPNIGGYNLYDRWHMIPTGKISIPPAPVKTNTVEVPGMNGEYDYTEIMGGPTYGMIEGEWEFYILNRIDPATGWPFQDIKDPDTVYKEVMQNIHGRKTYVILEGETDRHEGRFTVSKFEHTKDYAKMSISYKLYP